jgi:CRP/FNR family transcriptional regulator, cyclic AMP receptor protein
MELKDKSLLAQFQRPEGTPRLAEALRLQRLVCDQDIALELARHVKLEQVPSGGKLIRQGFSGSDLFLVLIGEFSVLVNAKLIERRVAGEYVGEMAVVDPSAPRSASVIAACDSVVARIAEPDFSKLANRFYAPMADDRVRAGGSPVSLEIDDK